MEKEVAASRLEAAVAEDRAARRASELELDDAARDNKEHQRQRRHGQPDPVRHGEVVALGRQLGVERKRRRERREDAEERRRGVRRRVVVVSVPARLTRSSVEVFPRGRVAAAPWPRRGYSVETSTVETGHDADTPWRRRRSKQDFSEKTISAPPRVHAEAEEEHAPRRDDGVAVAYEAVVLAQGHRLRAEGASRRDGAGRIVPPVSAVPRGGRVRSESHTAAGTGASEAG